MEIIVYNNIVMEVRIMLLIDYYFYFYNLDESQRNKEILGIIACLVILLFLGLLLEKIKNRYIYKVKNEKLRKILKKF